MEALLFGSAARGTDDSRSDYDVLVGFEDTSGINKECVKIDVEARIGQPVGLSIYGMKRLKAMWLDGSPFAWHLHLEAKPIVGFDFSLLRTLGQPAPYRNAAVDSKMMSDVLKSVAHRARSDIASICYEAGLLYVCARNISMFCSQSFVGRFDFSRSAPFSISSKVPFPISDLEYDILISARHASTRGAMPPQISSDCLVFWSSRLAEWASLVIATLTTREEC